MILVIGGFANGKLEFARNNLGVREWSDGSFESPCCVYNLQDMVMEEGFFDALDRYLAANPSAVLICNEVGGGIVPVDGGERRYRETVGRVCTYLAKRADAVYRVFCGIGNKIV